MTAPSSTKSTLSAADIVNLQAAVRSAVLGFLSAASSFSEMSLVLSSSCRKGFCGDGQRGREPDRVERRYQGRSAGERDGAAGLWYRGIGRRAVHSVQFVLAVYATGHAISRFGRSSK